MELKEMKWTPGIEKIREMDPGDKETEPELTSRSSSPRAGTFVKGARDI